MADPTPRRGQRPASPAAERGARPQHGSTFVELMIAVSIVGVALMVMLQQLSISFRENGINDHRVFAYQKAMAILAELQSGVERGDIPDAEALDTMADVQGYNLVLTTVSGSEGDEPLGPGHPMSGNREKGGQWLWSRVLEVSPPPSQEKLRYVKVKLYLRDGAGGWDLQATVGGVLALPARAFPASKIYDVYLLAIGEAPSLWLGHAAVRTLMENARQKVQTIDNGLSYRFHWITKLGYGRDPAYAPFVNTAAPASDAAPWIYCYPGLIDASGAKAYELDYLAGRTRTEDGFVQDWHATDNPYPHAPADQHNHCTRLPQAEALFAQRLAAGQERADEPPLQILLEDLQRSPDRYRNAMLVNLHGPGLPMPPLRNFSDPAKEPVAHPGVRVVTHPARLRTPRDPNGDGNHDDSQWAELRVYAWKTDPEVGPVVLDEPVLVQIFGLNLTAKVNDPDPDKCTLEIRRLQGGIDKDTGEVSLTAQYELFDSDKGKPPRKGVDAVKPGEMAYEIGYIAGAQAHTWIKLHNTPLVTPLVSDRGLAPAERLYGMEYIPSPVIAGGTFDKDLASTLAGPKNTARWRLRITPRVFKATLSGGFGVNADKRVTVVTRIGEDTASGVLWPTPNEPWNVSETYTWWASSTAAVPATERFQGQGDPRHNPYADLVAGGDMAHGYCWHFDNLRSSLADATAKWPCLDQARLQDGFGGGVIADAPRYLQLLRSGLQASGIVFTNPCGQSAHALLLGGELAVPGVNPGTPLAPIVVHGDLLAASAPVPVDTVSPISLAPPPGPGGGPAATPLCGRHVILGTGMTPWWSMEWLGELFPDAVAADWLLQGNLPTGALPGTFHRELRGDAVLPGLPAGTDFGFECGGVLGAAGTVALVDAGTLGATLLHQEAPAGSAGAITPGAQAIVEAVGEPVVPQMPCTQPFAHDLAFPGSLPYFAFGDSYPKSILTPLEDHYTLQDGLRAAAALRLEHPTAAKTAFLSLLGVTPTAPQEHDELATHVLMLALRTFHKAGESSVTGRITQVPLVEVLEPTEGVRVVQPTSMPIRWKVTFVRFDGAPFTSSYPAGFTEPEQDLVYSILFSRDTGTTWRHALDGSPAQAGVRPSNPALLLADAGTGAELYVLSTPSSTYVGAEYVFRIDCFHRTRQSHVAYHQVRVLVTR